jgi:LPS-assembly lipoprotein
MSWPEPRRIILFAGLLVALGSVLAACNVRPLYGTAPDGSNLQSELAFVDVAPVEGRVGQQVRNDLLFLMHGGAQARDDYVLRLNVSHSRSSIIVRHIGGQPQGGTISVQAAFRLRASGEDETLFSGRVVRHASYERSNQRFANDRAELDAENRAAREVAEEIRMRLAAYFTGDVKVQPRRNPSVSPTFGSLTRFDRPALEQDQDTE